MQNQQILSQLLRNYGVPIKKLRWYNRPVQFIILRKCLKILEIHRETIDRNLYYFISEEGLNQKYYEYFKRLLRRPSLYREKEYPEIICVSKIGQQKTIGIPIAVMSLDDDLFSLSIGIVDAGGNFIGMTLTSTTSQTGTFPRVFSQRRKESTTFCENLEPSSFGDWSASHHFRIAPDFTQENTYRREQMDTTVPYFTILSYYNYGDNQQIRWKGQTATNRFHFLLRRYVAPIENLNAQTDSLM